MKVIFRSILTLCLITLNLVVWAGKKDRRIQGKLTPLRTCFDVTHYGIRVNVTPSNHSISGSNTISFKVVSSFKKMQLDFVKTMQVDSILFKKRPVKFSHQKNIILIELPETLNKNEAQRIEVCFSGRPHVAELPPWKGGFVWAKDDSNNDWVGLACEGIGASVWLPCKDHWSDEADSMDMPLTVPEGLTGVSNGKLVYRSFDPAGFETFHWQVLNPINNYNISINIGKYAEINDTFRGINNLQLTYYVLQNNRDKAEKHFQQVKEMLRAFEHYFGAYPFPEDGYKLVETPYWGMEHQSCVAYGNHYKNNAFNFDFIIIHESGHEWYANSITARDPADMWIHESFTTYSEALYVEFLYGQEKAQEYLNSQRGLIKAKHPLQGPRDEFFHGQKDNDIYYKGTWMLHTMRHVLNNDSLWFGTIHNMSLHFRHSIVTTEDILAYFNSATGRNWDAFFRQYIYNGRLPVLEYQITPAEGGGQILKYRWKNCVKGFDMPIQLQTETGIVVIRPTAKFTGIRLSGKIKFEQLPLLYLITVKNN